MKPGNTQNLTDYERTHLKIENIKKIPYPKTKAKMKAQSLHHITPHTTEKKYPHTLERKPNHYDARKT